MRSIYTIIAVLLFVSNQAKSAPLASPPRWQNSLALLRSNPENVNATTSCGRIFALVRSTADENGRLKGSLSIIRKESFPGEAIEARTVLNREFLYASESSNPKLLFSPDCSRLMLYGYEITQELIDVATGRSREISIKDGAIDHVRFSEDGHKLFLVVDKDYRHRSVGVFDVDNSSWRAISVGLVLPEDIYVMKSGSRLLAIESENPTVTPVVTLLSAYDFGAKNISRTIVGNLSTMVASAQFYPTNRILSDEMIALEDRLDKKRIVRVVSVADMKERFSFDGQSPMAMSSDRFIFSRLEGTNEVVPYLADLNTGKVKRLAPQNRVGRMVVAKAGSAGVVARFANTFAAGVVLEYDREGRESELYATYNPAPYITTARHIVQSTNGFSYPAYLFTDSRRTTSRGVVVFVHGGGCHVYLTFSLLWREYGFLELVQAGYDVFAISYRNDVFNTPSYTPPQWGPSKCGTEEIEDIFAARRHVDLLYPNTPKFLYGYSQGGYLVNLATTLYGDQYHWNGIISAAGMWDLKLTGVEPYFIAGHYDVERNPIAYLNKLNSPILLLHGQADSNVGFEHAQRFLAEAERLGIKVESYLPEQEEHHIENATRWNTWMTLFIDFLDRHSGG